MTSQKGPEGELSAQRRSFDTTDEGVSPFVGQHLAPVPRLPRKENPYLVSAKRAAGTPD